MYLRSNTGYQGNSLNIKYLKTTCFRDTTFPSLPINHSQHITTSKTNHSTNMKFILFASIFSFAVAAAVAPPEYGNSNPTPYQGTLPQKQAEDIVNGFISVLRNQPYKGQPPSQTYKKYLSPGFTERSGSINSLISPQNNASPTETLLPSLMKY